MEHSELEIILFGLPWSLRYGQGFQLSQLLTGDWYVEILGQLKIEQKACNKPYKQKSIEDTWLFPTIMEMQKVDSLSEENILLQFHLI